MCIRDSTSYGDHNADTSIDGVCIVIPIASMPRKLNGMGDLFEFDLLPDIKGIYRRDYSRHTSYGDHNADTSIDGVLLSHAHVDHCAYIHYLRPEIPIYCSEASRLIMQCFEDTGGNEEYITYKENFKTYENTKGGQIRPNTPLSLIHI